MKNQKVIVKGLKKSFRQLHVLNGIDITINEGEVVCVIGPSGSGKSTFLLQHYRQKNGYKCCSPEYRNGVSEL